MMMEEKKRQALAVVIFKMVAVYQNIRYTGNNSKEEKDFFRLFELSKRINQANDYGTLHRAIEELSPGFSEAVEKWSSIS